MAANPDIDVVDYLAAQIGALTKGTNLFIGRLPAKSAIIPSKCASVLPTGGTMPMGFADGSDTAETYSSLQVRVRGEPRDYQDARDLAKSVWDTLNYATVSGYIECRCEQSEPLYLGEDSAGHHEWTVNVELIHIR
jgi:hypothetical protein